MIKTNNSVKTDGYHYDPINSRLTDVTQRPSEQTVASLPKPIEMAELLIRLVLLFQNSHLFSLVIVLFIDVQYGFFQFPVVERR